MLLYSGERKVWKKEIKHFFFKRRDVEKITITHKGKYYNVEYSIVNVSELEGKLRIDSEYYDPFYLSQIKKIMSHNWVLLKKLLKEPIYNGFDYRYFEEIGTPYVRVGDIKDFIIYLENTVKVNPIKKPKKILLEIGDILLTRKGTVGEVAIIYSKNLKNIIISSEIMKLGPDNSKINPYYLMVFLKSHFGEIQITQNVHGIAHVSITQEALENIKIPIPSDSFQKFIEKLVLKSYEERQKAEQLYKQAEEILLKELELKNWKPKTKKIKIGGIEFEEEENISIRMLSDVRKADRMDAEYWEPKYDEIEELIKNYKNGYDYLNNLTSPRTGYAFNSKDYVDEGIPLLRITNITSKGIDMSLNPVFLPNYYLDKYKIFTVKKDDLVISLTGGRIGEGVIGKAFVYLDEKPALLNQRILRLRLKSDKIKNINIIALIINHLNQLIVRESVGGVQANISHKQILRLPIPMINLQTQQKISQLIQQSFKARENSKKLLEIAKRTVEIYIEKHEKEGLSYAKNKLREINDQIS